MADEPKSIRALFYEAEKKRQELESSFDSNSATFQENLSSAIATYEECLKLADRVSLFSPNESVDDVGSSDFQYMAINFHLAELVQKITGRDRKSHLLSARDFYEQFLKLLDSYDLLSGPDAKLLELYRENKDDFAVASKTDAAARRDTKIARFREEKELKRKLDYYRQDPKTLENDEQTLRQLQLTHLALMVHQTFQSLESIGQELHILSLAPPPPSLGQDAQASDGREGDRRGRDAYSERLDTQLPGLKWTGPVLSADGKPLRPFTLLDTRQRLQQGVFRPDHSLPTMTIDEYLEEERRRGGIIEGGGEQSGIRPERDEDNYEKGEEETMKARAWDEFTEDNPKGAGNTLNRG